MTIVIDESVDYAVVRQFRKISFSIIAITDYQKSLSDEDVLHLPVQNNALLSTEDKDFGELVFRFNKKHTGIVLIRMPESGSEEKSSLVVQVITKQADYLRNKFTVIETNKVRVKD